MSIEEEIKLKLKTQLVSSRVLLDRLSLINEDSRKSSQYQDPNYLPFYYYLSRIIHPKDIVHIGFDLALPSCCFLQGSESVRSILGFQNETDSFYSPRLAFSNIKKIKGNKFNIDYYYGKIEDVEFINKLQKNFDLFIITEKINSEKINEYLEICWQYLNLDGFVIVDNIISDKNIGGIFKGFCKGKNRSLIEFKTRYGTGILQK